MVKKQALSNLTELYVSLAYAELVQMQRPSGVPPHLNDLVIPAWSTFLPQLAVAGEVEAGGHLKTEPKRLLSSPRLSEKNKMLEATCCGWGRRGELSRGNLAAVALGTHN